MKLCGLHEISICESRFGPGQTIAQILDNLRDKTLIVFSIATTGTDPSQKWTQLTQIAAVAIEANTGREIDSFYEVIELNLATLRKIDMEDEAKASRRWEEGNVSVREVLEIQGYDMELYDDELIDPDEADYGADEMNAVASFIGWIQSFKDAIIVSKNATYEIEHLEKATPISFPAPNVLDVKDFSAIYFEPMVRTLMMHGFKYANEMGERMWGSGKGNALVNMARALGVTGKKITTSRQYAILLSRIVASMLKFLHKHADLDEDEVYHTFSDRAARTREMERTVQGQPIPSEF